MSRLVDDLLFLARSDASSVPLELTEISAEELIGRLVGRAELLVRGRGASLAVEVSGSGSLNGDPDRIEQALLILIDNAAKYGPAGGTVELTARTTANQLAVEVRDRGPGIPEGHLDRVFERFYRLNGDGRDRSSGGAGLGLAIAAAIVEGHGGRIAAAARPGGGTVMSFTLPLVGAVAARSGSVQ
jgi:signal transduction histidine kinase